MRGSLPRSVLLILVAAQIALARSGDGLKALEKEIEALNQRQLAVEKDLQEALRRITGAAPYATFKEALDSLLSAQKD